MSETSGQQNDSKAQKRPKFVRQLSKSYEKSKEAVKRNLLTPRGARTKSTELPQPAVKPDAGVVTSQVALSLLLHLCQASQKRLPDLHSNCIVPSRAAGWKHKQLRSNRLGK